MNNTNHTIEIAYEFHPRAHTFQAILVTSLSVATLLCNVILILAVVRTSYLHTKTNVLLVSVAVSEVIIGVAVMPFTAAVLYVPSLQISKPLCDVIAFMTSLSRSSKSLSMLSVSIDRCVAISYPLQYNNFMSKLTISIIVTTVWSVSVLFSIFPLSNVGRYYFISVHGRCLIDFYLSPVFAIVKEVTCTIVPSFAILVSLAVIIVEARSHHRVTMIAQLAVAMYSGPAAARVPGINYSRSTLRAMRTYLTITCIYLSTCLPQSVYVVAVAGSDVQANSVYSLFSFLTYVCSISTPLVITTLNIKFRQSIKTIFSRRNTVKPVPDREPYTISTGLHSILESSVVLKCVAPSERVRKPRTNFNTFEVNLPGPSRTVASVRFVPRKVSVLHEVQSSSSSELSIATKPRPPAILRKSLSSPC